MNVFLSQPKKKDQSGAAVVEKSKRNQYTVPTYSWLHAYGVNYLIMEHFKYKDVIQ